MLEIVQAGGWLMLPIIACSVVAVAIVLERLWTLQEKRVLPAPVANQVWEWVQPTRSTLSKCSRYIKARRLGRCLRPASRIGTPLVTY